MLLVIQLIFAAIATNRGHGYKPWMYMVVAYGIMFGTGMTLYTLPHETLYTMGMVAGAILAVWLGYMAFNPPEGN